MADRSKQIEREEQTNPRVLLANSVSIMDYASKNDIEVVYEDQNLARITDVNGSVLTVFKDSNSWTAGNEEFDESKTYGNTIRFIARMENIDWREAIDLLVRERGEYQSAEEYNSAFRAELEQNPEAVIQGREIRTRQKEELQKLKDISIVEYAEKSGLPIKELHNKFVIIDDKQFEGLMIYKETNTWDWHSRFVKNANLIQFLERTESLTRDQALDKLSRFSESGKIITFPMDVKKKDPLIDQNDNADVIMQNANVGKDSANAQELNDKETNLPESESMISAKGTDPHHEAVRKLHKTMSKEQLSEILSGIRRGIDVTLYDNPDLQPDQMRQLRLAIQRDIEPSEFNSPDLTAGFMKEMRLAKQNGIDINIFKDKNNNFIFNADQIKEIRLGYMNGLQPQLIESYAKETLDSEIMKEVRLGLQDGMEQMKKLTNGNYTAKDIHAIRMTLMVNHIIDSIKLHMRNLYDSVIALFKRSIIYERAEQGIQKEPLSNDESKLETKYAEEADIEKEAVFEFKDAIESIYEALSEELQDLTLDEKKETITQAFRSILHQARELEQTVAAANESTMDKAVEEFIDEKEMEELRQAAYENLQEEYVAQFYENENRYNEGLVEFSDSLIKDGSIARDQKAEIFQRTLGIVFGEKIAQKWINRLPDEQQQSEAMNPMEMVKEEYEQVITITEELEYEVG